MKKGKEAKRHTGGTIGESWGVEERRKNDEEREEQLKISASV